MLDHLKKVIESLLRNISGPIGRKIRFLYYRNKFKSCGKNIIIDEGVYIEGSEFITLGDNIWIDRNVILIAGAFKPEGRKFYKKNAEQIAWGELIISKGVHIAPFSLIQSHGGVKIGRNVTVASGSKIYTLSHHYKNLNSPEDRKRYSFSTMADKDDQFLIVGNVIIGDDAAIGLNSVVLPGTIIPQGFWLGVLSTSPSFELKPNTVYSSQIK